MTYRLTSLCGDALALCFLRQEVRIAMAREYSDHPLCSQVGCGVGCGKPINHRVCIKIHRYEGVVKERGLVWNYKSQLQYLCLIGELVL